MCSQHCVNGQFELSKLHTVSLDDNVTTQKQLLDVASRGGLQSGQETPRLHLYWALGGHSKQRDICWQELL